MTRTLKPVGRVDTPVTMATDLGTRSSVTDKLIHVTYILLEN
jgi:hypothetical protein